MSHPIPLPAVRLPAAHVTTAADREQIRAQADRLREAARQAEAERAALLALADVVGDRVRQAGADPELRAAWIAWREVRP